VRRVSLAAKVRPDLKRALEDLAKEHSDSLSSVVETVLVEGLKALEGRGPITLEDVRQVFREELERICRSSQ